MMRFQTMEDYHEYVKNKLKYLNEQYSKYNVYGESGEYYISACSSLAETVKEMEGIKDEEVRICRNQYGDHMVMLVHDGGDVLEKLY